MRLVFILLFLVTPCAVGMKLSGASDPSNTLEKLLQRHKINGSVVRNDTMITLRIPLDTDFENFASALNRLVAIAHLEAAGAGMSLNRDTMFYWWDFTTS